MTIPSYRHCEVRDLQTGEVRARVPIASGETLFAALTRSGVPIKTSCYGSTICGLCWVVVRDGAEQLEPPLMDEAQLLAPTIRRKGVEGARLACRIRMPRGLDRIVVEAELGVR